MVFELSDSLINDSVINDVDKCRSLHNLFQGYEEGNLLLSASPELLEFLEDQLNDTLSRRVINYLQHQILVHYDVMWKIKVVLEKPDYNNHELAIDFFKRSSTIQPPTVLCENLDDTCFYFMLCKEYFHEDFINTQNGQGAGGSSVADNLEHIVNNNDRFCICIVDSDIKYPNSPEGGTYAAILNKSLESRPTYTVYKLNVHEIENLIPIDAICQHVKDSNVRRFARRLKEIDRNGDILFYYDVKKGISLRNIRQYPGYKQFAEDIYNRIKKPLDHKTFEEYIQSLKPGSDVFAPLCPGLLTSFINKDTRNKVRFEYCDYLRLEWENIRRIIVTFLCARQDDPMNMI